MVAEVEAATATVVTVNVVLVAPAAMVTDAGTVADAVLLERPTIAPPAGAGPFNVTVPVEEDTPETVAGFNVTVEGAKGLTVSTAGSVEPL